MGILFFVVLMFAIAAPLSARPPAGSMIDAQADLVFENANALTSGLHSNMVITQVLPLYGVRATGGQTVLARLGTTIYLPIELKNLANTEDVLAFRATVGGQLPNISWYYDDPEKTPIDSVDDQGRYALRPLHPQEMHRIVGEIEVPFSQQLGTVPIDITVVSQGDTGAMDATQFTVVLTQASVSITGDVQVYMGEEFSLLINYENPAGLALQQAGLTLGLDAGVIFKRDDASGIYDDQAHSVHWDLGTIPPDSQGSIEVILRAGEDQGLQGVDVLSTVSLTAEDHIALSAEHRTQIANRFPTQLSINVVPQNLLGDGESLALFTVAVTDFFGHPVDDGIEITFFAPKGVFTKSGAGDLVVPSAGGLALAEFKAPLLQALEALTIAVTVSALNPAIGSVQEQVEVVFSPGAVCGRLLDPVSGLPVAGAELQLIRNGELIAVAITDADGNYTLPVPVIGKDYQVQLIIDSVDGSEDMVSLPVSVAALFGEITCGPSLVQGRVIWDGTSEGVAGTKLYLYNEDGLLLGDTTSDDQGYYHFAIEPESLSELGALAATQWRLEAVTTIGDAIETNFLAPRVGEMVINLHVMLAPVGQVTDGVSGDPIEGAQVYLMHGFAEDRLVELPLFRGTVQSNPRITDINGQYIFHVQPDQYRLVVEADGYFSYESLPFMVDGLRIAEDINLYPLDPDGVTIEKSTVGSWVHPGSLVEYQLKIENSMSWEVSSILVEDRLPSGLEYVEGTATFNGTYDVDTHSVRWQVNRMPPGSKVLTYQVQVGHLAPGTELENRAALHMSGATNFAGSSVTVAISQALDVTFVGQPRSVGYGEFVRYAVEVRNPSGSGATVAADTFVGGTLPDGFVYLPGTSRLNGTPVGDPISVGGELQWFLGDIAPGEEHTLTYIAVVSVAARGGENYHRLRVDGLTGGLQPFSLGPFWEKTVVSSGIFGSSGAVIGQVFLNQDGSGLRKAEDLGVGDVHLYLDNGIRVITDEHGRFSLPHVEPGLRVLGVDPSSLPRGMSTMTEMSSFFLWVPPRGLAQLNIPLKEKQTPAGQVQVSVQLGEIDQGRIPTEVTVSNNGSVALMAELVVEATSLAGDAQFYFVNERDSQLEIQPGSNTSIPGFVELQQETGSAGVVYVTPQVATTDHVWAVAAAAQFVAPAPERQQPLIVSPAPGEVHLIRHGAVVVRMGLDEQVQLWANSEAVSSDQVGKIATDYEQGIIEKTFYNVAYREGRNVLRVEAVGPNGVRAEEIEVFIPGAPAQLHLITPGLLVEERQRNVINVLGIAVDATGIPAPYPSAARVTVRGGTVLGGRTVEERSYATVATKQGLIEVAVIPDDIFRLPVQVDVAIGEAVAKTTVPMQQTPSGAFTAIGGDILVRFDPTLEARIRGSAYLQVLGDTHIEARYDLRHRSRGQWVINPLLPMPLLTGDQSVWEDTAQSQSPLYLFVNDSESGSLLYGDFSLEWLTPSRFVPLTGAVTGVQARALDDRFHGFYFAQQWERYSERILGAGISDFYYLKEFPIPSESEQVWMIVVDSADPQVELSRTLLERHADYAINYQTGALHFLRSIPHADDQFNPILIEVSYPIPGLSQQASGFGLWAQLADSHIHQATFRTLVGSAFTNRSLGIVAVDGRISSDTSPVSVEYEWAHMYPGGGSGMFGEISIEPQPNWQLEVSAQSVQGKFVPSLQDKPLPEGHRLHGSIKYSFDENWSLLYNNELVYGDLDESTYSDALRLQGFLAEQFRFSAGLSFTADRFTLFGTRSSSQATLTADWDISPEARLSFERLHPLSGLDTGLTQLKYSHAIGRLGQLMVTYRDQITKAGSKKSLDLGIRLAPFSGTLLYGRYQPAVDLDRAQDVVVGFGQEFSLSDNLAAMFSQEYRSLTAPDGSIRELQTGTVGIEYRISRLTTAALVREWLAERAKSQVKTEFSLTGGRADRGLSYLLSSVWRSTNQLQPERPELVQETRAAVAFRPVDGSPHTGFAQLNRRRYNTLLPGSSDVYATETTTVSVEWSLRLSAVATVSAQAAAKLSAEEEYGIPGSQMQSRLYLSQVSWQSALGDDYRVELFLRRLWDDSGHDRFGWATELTRSVTENLGISLGWSSLGVDDPDLDGVIDWPPGMYARLRMKF